MTGIVGTKKDNKVKIDDAINNIEEDRTTRLPSFDCCVATSWSISAPLPWVG